MRAAARPAALFAGVAHQPAHEYQREPHLRRLDQAEGEREVRPDQNEPLLSHPRDYRAPRSQPARGG